MMSQSGCSHEQNLKVILEAYNRALFHFPFDHFPLEAEYHIWGALKKSPVFVPAHAASAVLQSDELLFHWRPQFGQIRLLAPIAPPFHIDFVFLIVFHVFRDRID